MVLTSDWNSPFNVSKKKIHTEIGLPDWLIDTAGMCRLALL
jgi:hypothetical protein